MDCPRCQSKLEETTIDDCRSFIVVDKCTCCGGIWFDKDELKQIESIIEPTLLEIRHLPNEAEQLKSLHCPSCNNSPRMEKSLHPRDRKVIFDYCPYCKGIWLDKGELEAIQQESWLHTLAKLVRHIY